MLNGLEWHHLQPLMCKVRFISRTNTRRKRTIISHWRLPDSWGYTKVVILRKKYILYLYGQSSNFWSIVHPSYRLQRNVVFPNPASNCNTATFWQHFGIKFDTKFVRITKMIGLDINLYRSNVTGHKSSWFKRISRN